MRSRVIPTSAEPASKLMRWILGTCNCTLGGPFHFLEAMSFSDKLLRRVERVKSRWFSCADRYQIGLSYRSNLRRSNQSALENRRQLKPVLSPTPTLPSALLWPGRKPGQKPFLLLDFDDALRRAYLAGRGLLTEFAHNRDGGRRALPDAML